MAASAFTRFDPGAFLRNLSHEGTAAKATKPAKVPPERKDIAATFATFATFAEAAPKKAAIARHDGGAPREWVEGLTRLDPATPPVDVPPERWLRFVDDSGRFIANGWARRAAELGWTAFDLFGCDRSKPFARIGRCGLLWLLDGRPLRILTADTAVINAASGFSLTFYRRPHEPGQVLPWEFAP
jgi:hypothetical protein